MVKKLIEGDQNNEGGTTLLHKVSKNYLRDRIWYFHGENKNEPLYSAKCMNQLKAFTAFTQLDVHDQIVFFTKDAERLLREAPRQGAQEEDQVMLSKPFKKHITDMLGIPFEFLYDLCPFEPFWLRHQHYDLLENEWPQTICFVHPPKRLMKVVFMKALMRFFKGGDTIVLAADQELDSYVDSRISQGSHLYQNMGSPLFEPFKA